MKKLLVPVLIVIILILNGCSFLRTQNEDSLATATPPSITPTPLTEETALTVCLGQEPDSLYPFGELNSAARSVLAAIYDGPFDTIAYEYQPVILTKIPSIENGDAQIVRITVDEGDMILDATGALVPLEEGVRARPAECRSDDCAVTYNGEVPLEMDQMIVTFHIRPDLTWSDGTPLTADDSVYSYQLHAEAGIDPYLTARTQVYEAADAQTLQWFGMPGFIDPTYFLNFWSPAPKHLWGEFPADELPSTDVAARTPTGWGPFMVKEWIPNDHITLTKNPNYFRAEEGYPLTSLITFRFIPDPDAALTELIAGRCDIIEPTINLENHVGLLQEMQSVEQARIFFSTGMSIEWLGLGIAPASYDDGQDPQKDRPNIFGDLYTRQGIAYCLNRQAVVNDVLFGMTTVPTSFIPVEHPLYDENIEEIPYDPEVGISLLEQAGWLDADDDPSTPRRAINVKGVAYNTPLQLNYYTTTSTQRRQVVDILEDSLAECGIGLNVEYFSANDLYASGPNGLIFGRQFDLAEYALGVEGIEPPCGWFSSSEIPSEANGWSGTNLGGFSDEDYDLACLSAGLSMRDEQAYLNFNRETQIIFADELPAIPLFYRLRIAAAQPDVCGFDLDPTANPLWNIESFGSGETCQN